MFSFNTNVRMSKPQCLAQESDTTIFTMWSFDFSILRAIATKTLKVHPTQAGGVCFLQGPQVPILAPYIRFIVKSRHSN